MSQLTTRDYKGAARGARRARGASRARRSGNTGGLHQFLWGGIAGAILVGAVALLILHHADESARVHTASDPILKSARTPPPAVVPPASRAPASGTTPPQSAPAERAMWSAARTQRLATVVRPNRAAHPLISAAADHGDSLLARSVVVPPTNYTFYELLPKLRVSVPPPSAPGVRGVGPNGRTRFAGYFLQAAVYSSRARARKLVSYLNFLGTLAHIDTVHNGARTLYEVRVGPVIERWEINRFRHQLRLIGLHPVLIPGSLR